MTYPQPPGVIEILEQRGFQADERRRSSRATSTSKSTGDGAAMADVNEMIGGYQLRSAAADRADVQVLEVVEPTSNRHFAMKLLLPEAADEAGAPASAVPRGRGRHQADAPEHHPHPQGEPQSQDTRTSSWSSSRRAACGCGLQAKDFAFIKEHSREDLQAGGDRAGVHERERAGSTAT